MFRKATLALLSLWVLVSNCHQTHHFDKPKLDSFFTAMSAHDQTMGSIAIAENGKIVYQKAIGYSQVDGKTKTPANLKTKYKVGSITKMFTAVMVFQLIEEGKLTLNTTLGKYYPQLSNAGKITIAEMLSHRSGLHNFTSDSLYMSYKDKPMSEADMVAIFAKQKPDFEPDTKAEYSNTNFVLLGQIVEKITGKSYREELKERITSKIGLEDTFYGTKSNTAENEAFSYYYLGEWSQLGETDMSIPGGAGALVSTPADLVKFIDALFTDKLISPANLEHMKTMRGNFGMAMFMMPFDDKTGYGHNGGLDAFVSELVYFPADKVAIAYTSNGQHYPFNNIVNGALSIYFNKPFTIPQFKTAPVIVTNLDKYLGRYISTKSPLKIAITKKKNTLFGQANGQMAYPLEAKGNDRFELGIAGLELQFDTVKHNFIYFQNGETYEFSLVK
ncbi:MAG: serine hydrolase domain-containing protein [Bacteroidota bacterium]